MATCALEPGDILPPQSLVERDGGVDLAHHRRRPFGEAPAPHLVGAPNAPFAIAFAHLRARPGYGGVAIGESAEPAQPWRKLCGGKREAGCTARIDRGFAGQAIPAVELHGPVWREARAGAISRSKPVLVNLWATWCAPCVILTEMPLPRRPRRASWAKPCGVLTIQRGPQRRRGCRAVLRRARKFAHLPQWMDPKNDLAVAYGLVAPRFPWRCCTMPKAKEPWRVVGGDWGTAEARELIAEAT